MVTNLKVVSWGLLVQNFSLWNIAAENQRNFYQEYSWAACSRAAKKHISWAKWASSAISWDQFLPLLISFAGWERLWNLHGPQNPRAQRLFARADERDMRSLVFQVDHGLPLHRRDASRVQDHDLNPNHGNRGKVRAASEMGLWGAPVIPFVPLAALSHCTRLCFLSLHLRKGRHWVCNHAVRPKPGFLIHLCTNLIPQNKTASLMA